MDWGSVAARRAAGSYTLTRAPAKTLYWTPDGKRLKLESVLPQRVGQTKELWVRVADQHRHLMRLLILRVPEEVAKLRRANLEADAKRRHQPVRQRAWELAAWTILRDLCPSQTTELARSSRAPAGTVANGVARTALWKQDGRLDEWRTANPWRVVCELYAKLIGLLLQHWLLLLFAWHKEQRSLVKLARGACVIPLVLSWKLWRETALCGRPCGLSNSEWGQERR